jgi:hypothetical protein
MKSRSNSTSTTDSNGGGPGDSNGSGSARLSSRRSNSSFEQRQQLKAYVVLPSVASTVSFDKYLKFLKTTIEEAHHCYSKRELANSYINYVKFAQLFIKLKAHPDYKSPKYGKNIAQLGQCAQVALAHIENIAEAMDAEEDVRISNKEAEELADMFDGEDDCIIAISVNSDLWKFPVNTIPLIPAPVAASENKETEPGQDEDLWKSLHTLTLQQPTRPGDLCRNNSNNIPVPDSPTSSCPPSPTPSRSASFSTHVVEIPSDPNALASTVTVTGVVGLEAVGKTADLPIVPKATSPVSVSPTAQQISPHFSVVASQQPVTDVADSNGFRTSTFPIPANVRPILPPPSQQPIPAPNQQPGLLPYSQPVQSVPQIPVTPLPTGNMAPQESVLNMYVWYMLRYFLLLVTIACRLIAVSPSDTEILRRLKSCVNRLHMKGIICAAVLCITLSAGFLVRRRRWSPYLYALLLSSTASSSMTSMCRSLLSCRVCHLIFRCRNQL